MAADPIVKRPGSMEDRKYRDLIGGRGRAEGPQSRGTSLGKMGAGGEGRGC